MLVWGYEKSLMSYYYISRNEVENINLHDGC